MRTGSSFSLSGKAHYPQADPQQNNSQCGGGSIALVGLGPGSIDYMTVKARQVINEAQVIVGYKTYMKLVEPLLLGQQQVVSGMRQEVERANRAVDLALTGKNVAVISSGDPGIYGMAGVLLEVLGKRGLTADKIPVQVIPGVTAANAAASILGSPLMHDNAAVSLSDLLTPWEQIARRLELAAEGDFVISLFNPKSNGRPGLIEKARDIILAYRSQDTPVGIVRRAYREGQNAVLSTLADFTKETIDMFSIVIIGNSRTYIWDNKIITPRGYKV